MPQRLALLQLPGLLPIFGACSGVLALEAATAEMAVKRRRDGSVSDVAGVYRYRELVNGSALWYAVDGLGQVIALKVCDETVTEAEVADEMIVALRGDAGPRLTLVTPASSPSPSPASFVRLLRLPQPVGRVLPRHG